MVSKGYAQVEGIDFEETYALVARFEAIQMFLALSFHKKFKVYQMDFKFAFLNGKQKKKYILNNMKGFFYQRIMTMSAN